jgi:hypothetical protein
MPITHRERDYIPTRNDPPALQAQRIILEAVNRGILKIEADAIQFNAEKMATWLAERGQLSKLQGKTGMKLVMAMPASTFFALQEQNFDNSPNWEANSDVIKWLRNRPGFEFLRLFPDAGKEAKEVV